MSVLLTKVYYKLKEDFLGFGLYENVNATNFLKNCLILYIVEPFRSGVISNVHQNQWQVRELANIIGEFGYNVDVVRFDNHKVKLNKKYDLVVDIHPGLNQEVYKSNVMPELIKIAYLTGSNPAFSNVAELTRIEELYHRKGIAVSPRRKAKLLEKEQLESFDAIFFLGNHYNLKTYKEFDLPPVHFIKNTGYKLANYSSSREKSPKNFLFLTSVGQVFKGLDRLLEVFSANPDLRLYICSNFKSERDFCNAYREELFNRSNIFPVGFVDIRSEKFASIVDKCCYMVLPSCSEANAGSVLTAMSFGLIPIVSRECGFEDDEVYYFEDCSIESIARTIQSFASNDMEYVRKNSQRIFDIVNSQYSRNDYSVSIRNGLQKVLSCADI